LDAAQAASQIGAAWRRPHFEKALPGPGLHLEQPVETLDEVHAKSEIESFGVGVPRGERVASVDALKNAAESLTYPLVLKACDTALLHKSEAGAVMVGIDDFDELVAGATSLFSRYPSLLVEEMITDTVCELIVGVRQDPVIGPWMMIGSGGIYAELLGDTRVTLLPARDDEFETMISSLKIHPLLNGYRGSEAGDVPALLATLQRVADFVMEKRDSLVELEINPLLVRRQGKGVCAVDAVLQYARAS
jgi:acyl-CoA synthetase (NDP forming)